MVISLQSISIAQFTNLNIRSEYYSVHNGLNNAEIFGIVESHDGYIWLATESGIVRYDGHTFKSFTFDVNDTTAISNNYVKRFCLDKHGRLWLAAGKYLDVFDTKTFTVSHCRNKEDALEGKYKVHNFTYDYENDEMWISTEKGVYVNKGNPINLQKKTFPFEKDYNLTNCNILIDKNIVWLCSTYGLCKWNKDNNQYKVFHRTIKKKNNKDNDDDGFFNIYKDPEGILWIGNWVYGVMRFDPLTERMDNYLYRPSDGQNCVYFAHDFNSKIFSNLLMIGTMHGLKLFDKKQRKFISETSINLNLKTQLANFSMLESARSGIWIGTSKGLYRLDLNSRFIQSVALGFTGASALSEINELFFEPNKNGIDSILWFTASYYKLFKYDLIHKKELPLPPKLYPYGQALRGLYDLYIDRKSTLWMTSLKDTLIGYDINNDKIIKPFFTSKNPIALSIAEDQNSDLWLGTFNGLYYYNRQNNILIENKEVSAALKKYNFSKKLLRIEVDKNNNVWMVSGWQDGNVGLVFYNPKNHIVKCYNIKNNKALLAISQIESIKNVNDELIVTGLNGFTRCSIDQNGLVDLKIVSHNHSWKSRDLRQTKLKGKDQLWFITKHGVINYNLVNDQMLEFNHVNSNIGVDLTDFSYSNQSQKIYMSRINQLDYFHTDSIKKFVPQKVVLTNLTIANYYLKSLPLDGSSLKLKSHQNSLQFEFSNLSFNNSIENGYFYKVNKELLWRKMNGNRLSFDGLGKGNYFLEVIASNCYGTINRSPFVFHIAIMPPFYQSWWFYVLCMMAIGLLFYYLYRLKVKELERLQKVRQNIARDLHDDMGSNLSHIKLLSEVEAMTNPDQPVFNTIVQKMSEVMNNMSEIIWNANPKNDKIEDVLYRIQEYASSILEPLGIVVKSNFDMLHSDLVFDIEQKRNFYLLFKEAINNIGKYAKAKHVSIKATSHNGAIAISIEDNGIGFDPLLIKRGNGLVNMQERAAFLNGELKIATGENGTTITLVF